MKINTNEFKSTLSLLNLAAAKSISNENIMTEFIELSSDNGSLYGYTFDNVNYLKIKIGDCTEDFKATVNFFMLYNLIKTIKTDEFEMKVVKNALNIKSSNLNCNIPLQKDASKNLVLLPKFSTKDLSYSDIDMSNIKNNISLIKSIIDLKFSVDCYRHILLSKSILFTNTSDVILIDDTLFTDILLLSYKSIEILSSINGQYAISNNKLYIHNDNIDLMIMEQPKTDYEYKEFLNLFKMTFDYTCTIKGEELNNALNICNLYNYYKAELEFTKDGVYLSIKSIDFRYKISDTSCTEFSYLMSLDRLKKLIVSKDDITISYGNKDLIRVDHDNIHGIFSAGD